MNDMISALSWRYATKKFDANKKLSAEQLDTLLEVLRLTPSSFGLQLWKFIVVENPSVREELMGYSWGQKQIVDASHLLVLCRKTQIDASLVESYISDTLEKTGAPAEALQGYKDMLLGFIQNLSPEIAPHWADKQVYIALGNALTVAASMQIDTYPMEGFSKADYDRVLGLPELGLASVLVLPVGYRAEDDSYATRPKIRYASEDVILHLS